MAPSKTLGRPRNAWNSSRRRKLVRLCTLTTLKNKEIQQVLKAQDFNPCPRDIQSKLKELFPNYRKEHRQYRPKNGTLATVRFKRLQQHRKTRKSCAEPATKKDQEHSTTPSKDTFPSHNSSQAFEGPLSAFRNYARECNASADWHQLSCSAHPSESQLVVPSLLLLDGSSIADTAVIPRGEFQFDRVQSSAPHQSSPNYPMSAPPPGHSHSHSSQSSVVSLRSLEARLEHRSSSVIRHIDSVLRNSLTNSWRSSTSWRSSWLSFQSQISTKSANSTASSSSDGNTSRSEGGNHESSSHGGADSLPTRLSPKPRIQFPKALNKISIPMMGNAKINRQQNVGYTMACAFSWNDCRHTIEALFLKQNLSFPCENCGMGTGHLLALSLAGNNHTKRLTLEQTNQKDFIDNRPLHYAAITESPHPDAFIKLINMGADIQSVNTAGATFLHLLFDHITPRSLSKFMPLLRRLAAIGFSFSSRDYRGRQLFHVLLEGFVYSKSEYLAQLEAAFAITKPDVDALDSAGACIRTYFSNLVAKGKIKAGSDEFITRCPISGNTKVNFKTTFLGTKYNRKMWIEWLGVDHRSVWIDANGDTALIALLKYWGYDQDELLLSMHIKEMVNLGAEIHMRDRHGETALAIAARRGLRPAVKTLIELGASIHSATSRGIGILSNARQSMHRAKKQGNDKLYAMIWSCIIYLVDLKACEFPSRRRQYWAAWAPDSHFPWDEGKEETTEKISRILNEQGFI